MESSCTAHNGGMVLGVKFTDRAQNVWSSLCMKQRVYPGARAGSPPGTSGHCSIFLLGPAASTANLALIDSSSPDVSHTNDGVQPDGTRVLYLLLWLRPLPSPTQDRPAQSLSWCGHKVSCCSRAPWLTFAAPLRLERPGRMPAGGLGCSPRLLPSTPGLWPEPGQGPCWSSQATPGVMV